MRRHLVGFFTGCWLLACGDGRKVLEPVPPPPAPDTIAPTVPTGLTATAASSSRIALQWNAATDNVGVADYRTFRDNAFLAAVTTTGTADDGRTPGLSYCYAVTARDTAGNESARSAEACVATVNQPPRAMLAAPDPVLTGEVMQFDGVYSTDSDGVITSYAFDFGDGAERSTNSDPRAQHSYAAGGIYRVTLTVTDNHGAQGSRSVDVAVGIVLLDTVNVSRSPGVYSLLAAFAATGTGPIDVVWRELSSGNNLLYSRSTDGGASFATNAPLLPMDDPYAVYDWNYPDVVTVGSDVHVAWNVFGNGATEALYSRSTDNGATFTPSRLVSLDDGNLSGQPQIAADASGTVAITWTDAQVYAEMTPGLWVRVSTDGGETFSTPVFTARSSVNCSNVAISGDSIYIVWIEGPSFEEQVLVSYSTDRGATFSDAGVIEASSERSTCPRIGTAPDGAVYVVWVEGMDAAQRVLFSRSTSGNAFTAPKQISPLGISSYCPALAVGDGRVYLSWTSYDQTIFNTRTWLVFSSDGGETFSSPRWIPSTGGGSGCYQILPRGPNTIGLGWWRTTADGYSDVIFGRIRLSVP